MYTAFKQRNERNSSSKSVKVNEISNKRGDFMDKLDDNIALRIEFYEFAKSRYCMESILFLNDVREFRKQYPEKNVAWHRNKTRKIINAYINIGSPLEININSDVRSKIIKTNLSNKNNIDYLILFNEAYEEVISMISSGTYVDFQTEKRKKEKKLKKKTASVYFLD